MAGGSLGSARGTIDFTYNGSRATRNARDDLDGVGDSGKKTKAALNDVANTSGKAGLAIAGGLGLAVNSAAKFEESLSRVKAVTGASGKEMENFSKKALQIGADTKYSANEGALAIEELAKAGISIPDIMNGAADATVALAAAGGVDLPQAAMIAANSMNQFGLSAEKMPMVADRLAGAANASATDVNKMGQALSQVGAVAATVGVSFEDTVTSIGLMANAGIKGSDAGTSLKTMLMRLEPASKKQRKLFDELGITTDGMGNKFFDAEGNFISMSNTSQVLSDALDGMSEQQRLATLTVMFGSDAVRAGAVFSKEGAAGFDELATSIGKVSAADVAATKMDNMMGKIEFLRGSVETLAIQLGMILIPALTDFAKALGQAVNAFSSISPEMQKVIVFSAAIAAALLLTFAVVVKTTLAVMRFVAAMRVLAATAFVSKILTGIATAFKAVRAAAASAWLAALGPIGLIIAAVALVGIALWAFFTKTETGRALWATIWAGIKSAAAAVWGWITGTLVPGLIFAWNAITHPVTIMGPLMAAAWAAVKAALVEALLGIVAALVGWGMGVVAWFTGLWAGFVGILTVAWTAIGLALSAAGAFLMGLLQAMIAPYVAIWTFLWGLFGPLVEAAWRLIVAVITMYINTIAMVITTGLNAIASFFRTVWDGILSLTRTVVNAIVTAVHAGWDALQAATTFVWNAIKGVIAAVWSYIGPYVTAAANAVKVVVTSAWNTIKDITTFVWNAISAVISSVWNSIKGVVSVAATAIKSVIESQFNAAKGIASAAFSAMSSAIGDRIRSAYEKVRSIVGLIRNVFSGAGGWLINAGRAIIDGLIRGIQNGIGKMVAVLNGITAKIPKVKGPPAKDKILLEDNGELIMGGLIRGLSSQLPRLEAMLGGVTATIPSAVGSSGVATASAAARSPRVAPAPASPVATRGSALIGTQNVYNPVTMPASQSAQRSAQRAALIGGPR